MNATAHQLMHKTTARDERQEMNEWSILARLRFCIMHKELSDYQHYVIRYLLLCGEAAQLSSLQASLLVWLPRRPPAKAILHWTGLTQPSIKIISAFHPISHRDYRTVRPAPETIAIDIPIPLIFNQLVNIRRHVCKARDEREKQCKRWAEHTI